LGIAAYTGRLLGYLLCGAVVQTIKTALKVSHQGGVPKKEMPTAQLNELEA